VGSNIRKNERIEGSDTYFALGKKFTQLAAKGLWGDNDEKEKRNGNGTRSSNRRIKLRKYLEEPRKKRKQDCERKMG